MVAQTEARPSAATDPLLTLVELEAWYGRSHVLFGVNLHVAAGEVVALLGRNGAGKSTTLKSIMGLIPAVRGRVFFQGAELAGRAAYQVCGAGIGYVPQERRIFGDLTVGENLEVGRRRREGGTAWGLERVLDLFPALRPLQGRRASRLSGGEQQMLAIARTLMGNPTLVLLDEPSEGLAPVVAQTLAQQIAALKGLGLSVLMSEQNLRFAARVSDRAYILEKGGVCFEGPMGDVATDATVRRKYLMV